MASFTKIGTQTRAQIRRPEFGVRSLTKTFPSKAAAEAWAWREEAAILAGARGEIPDKDFGAALERYSDEVSSTKKGYRWEAVRLAKAGRDPIAKVKLKDMDGSVVAAWRDRGLAAGLMPASVRREWNLLSSVCSVAIAEWKWMKTNPFGKAAGVKRPANSAHREVTIQPEDFTLLADVAQSRSKGSDLLVLRVLHFATETAMRAGEIMFLGENPDRVCTRTRVARLPYTKNGSARDVPLSSEAVRLWEEANGSPNRWGMNSANLDSWWRDLRDEAKLGHIHFHDTRHTAITRLAKKLQILDLARMTGHKDLKELMTYYNESAASIAQKLG